MSLSESISGGQLDKKGNRSFKISMAPAIEPITVDEVKDYARIDGDEEDTLIGTFITVVRGAAENYLGRSLIQRTMVMIMDTWPSTEIELPMPPLISISSVVTVDEDDTETTYSSNNYFSVTESIPGKLVLKYGVTPPENTDRFTAGYKITWLAGYGDDITDVPMEIRTALKLWAVELYENRASTTEPPPMARPLLNLYRVIKY